MEINKYVSNLYETIHPYVGVNSIEDKLIEKEYFVVADNDEYIGILTSSDLIKRPHKIAIDCLTEKEHICCGETVGSILDKFNRTKCPALPVFEENRFIGIVERSVLTNKLNHKINDLYEKSLISEKLKTSFLRNLSHEIRTPLNGLLGFLEIVLELDVDNLKDNEKLDNRIIRNCADKFLLVMDDLIDLSLIHSGDKVEILKEDTRIEDIFSDLREFFTTSLSILEKKVSVSYINQDSTFTIYSDGKRIKNMLYHLIDHSIKFSSNGEVNYGYKTDDHNILFYVTNHCPDINKETKDRIVNIFYGQYTSEDDSSSMFGIGLPLVKKMSELLGGKVDFVSNEQETTFFISLPLN